MISEKEEALLVNRERHLFRLVAEAHGEFLTIAARFGAEDTRWMLEAEILLRGGTIPRKGMSRGELKQVLEFGRDSVTQTASQ